MFANAYFALRYFARRYFSHHGGLPTHVGVPTVCPPVTPDWELLNITSNLSPVSAGWKPPNGVDDNLES